ncbi:MAG: SpoIIE family protein phosphatase [Atopobiaceae bacterium]|nr:SpoIIE family protein phosphatase [Atopobiaceae bacterium]
MTNELMRNDALGVVTHDETAMLASLLALTSDAVLVFNESGRILLANEEAERVFRALSGSLTTQNVRMLFPPTATSTMPDASLEESLPFLLDGSSNTLICETHDGRHVRMQVRCERMHTETAAYMLCARVLIGEDGKQDGDERLLDELSRANRRLSGTLGIVLGTLDSLDVGTLFNRILDEITETMDAWATLAYVAEHDGYRLRGTTESLGNAPVPSFVGYDDPLAQLASARGSSARMQVVAPTRKDLRQGALRERTVICEDTGASISISTVSLPPFLCFVTVPIWFGGQMIALLIVGWRHARKLRKDDLALLDAVAEYLSVQLAGAFAAMRAQHAEHLDSLASELRERLLTSPKLDAKLVESVFLDAASAIESTCASLVGNVHQRTTVCSFAEGDMQTVPTGMLHTMEDERLPMVLDVSQVEGLCLWLERLGEPTQGLYVQLGQLEGAQRGFLLLKDSKEEPFEESDKSFVRRLAEDVLEVEEGERTRKRDTRISQALQRGMRNELQRVDGLSTQSVYSSATEAAYVGGDFYDLVRLPDRHACVVMGDVSGKGVEAASVSSAVKTALSAYAWEGLTPARMVSLLNDFLLGFSRLETFATLFVGVIDLPKGVLTYCSAGHPPALMVRARTGELTSLDVQSGVVGAFANMRYSNGEVALENGDTLLLYTDGVTEARNKEGAFFGEDGLREVVSRESAVGYQGLCDRIVGAVASFAGGSLEDDVALVVLRLDEVGTSL